MKFDTKKTTPLSPSMMSHENVNIPKNYLVGEENDGRQVMYEPTIVFTPVLSSNRTHRSSPTRPRVSKSTLDTICSMLQGLFIKEAKAQDEDELLTQTTNNNDKNTDDDKEKQTPQERLGRVEVVTSKGNISIKSARIAALAAKE